ncbi:MAG: N-acetylneuraminate synthase [bacterium]|nr:N-acetylneuraminate synthase [bacterium]
MKTLFIQKKKINYGLRPFVIAEAGVNHNGSLDLALKLVDAAAFAGADAVKFQTFRAEQVVTTGGEMADYQKRNLGKKESQLAMLKKLELKEKYYPVLIQRAKDREIIFLSTPHGGFESVDLLQKLKIPAFKFGSGDLTNLPLLEYAAKFKKPMIISTGMSSLKEIKEATKAIKKAGNNQIIALHCTTDYPLAPENVNLRAMQTMMKELDVLVGYSDHTIDSRATLMAVTLGACMLEKHLTLDRKLAGPDHSASMEPAEFKKMVEQIRSVQEILGSPEKKFLKCEQQYVLVARKSLVASGIIKKGEKFTKNNLAIKRPGTGILPKRYEELLGKRAKVDIKKDRLIAEEMF